MDASTISSKSSVFETPWFDLVEKLVGPDCSPHYSISTQDYLSVLAVTRDGMFPLVRQFRPTVEMVTLELSGGHVDEGESPEEAARKELQEETGFIVDDLIPLGALAPDNKSKERRFKRSDDKAEATYANLTGRPTLTVRELHTKR